MITVDNLTVEFDACKALDSVSFHVNDNEKVAIVGPSGAGKSTLLKEIYRLHASQSSFIHQHFALVPQLSVFHNVYMGRLDQFSLVNNIRNLILPAVAPYAAVRVILESLGMAALIDRRVSQLSGGEQQRVAIARALYRNAPCLLGDEPVSSIDPGNSTRVMNLLEQVHATVIVSMHDIDLARKYFSRIIGLRTGQIVFDLPREAVSERQLLSLYAVC